MNNQDTIASVATPWGEGGVGIVRISGKDALKTALSVFTPGSVNQEIKPRRLYYGNVMDPEGSKAVDDGFLVYMKGPSSYTGEDVVELQCHGGPLVLKKVLELVMSSGARLSEPGEFTKRAFLNGRLDLAQAEAVIDVIRAQTESALLSARGRLQGVFSVKVGEIKEILASLLARIEAELDFAEEEIEALPDEDLLNGLDKAEEKLKKMLATYEEGAALKYGVKVLILGRPNVGKSSLLNVLLKEERAIVTPVPGTTRDVIEEVINLRGLPMRLMDTAGLRETPDHVESIGVRRTKERIKEAQLVLFVIDTTGGGFSEDLGLLKELEDKKVIVTANKVDLVDDKKRVEIKDAFSGFKLTFISALYGQGIDGLKEAVFEESAGHRYGSPGVSGDIEPGELVSSSRHRESLSGALEGIDRIRLSIMHQTPREFIAADLRLSLNRLGEITGETTTEDILDRIFSEFCIGK